MGRLLRFGKRLWNLTAPRKDKQPVIAISDSHAHYCEGCRCYVKITLWEMDTCPNCGSDQIKFAASWMRTPGEQQARSEAQQRKRFVKALNGGIPKPLPKRTVTVQAPPPRDAA